MDRRYSANRFYNGSRANTDARNQSEALVRSHLARAKQQAGFAQSYGGSTGGRSSMDGSPGLNTLLTRNEILKNERETFRQAGSGALGARASVAEAQGYR